MFIPGQIYNRRKDIHRIYGGQMQGGIATPAKYPLVFIFTDKVGEQYGYSDGWQEDGLFHYSGEGQKGDQVFTKGNLAIRDHIKNGKDIHLFERKSKGNYRYISQLIFTGYSYQQAPDKERNTRRIIVFELAPISDEKNLPSYDEMSSIDTEEHSLIELKKIATEAASQSAPNTQRIQNVYKRSEAIRQYALKRANGKCEGCGKEAPFINREGNPYLEVHHIRKLSDGGPDDPRYVIALCPNCHRRAHHGGNAIEYNQELDNKIKDIEG